MLTNETLPEEITRAHQKFLAREARAAKDIGEGDTEAGLSIARKYLPKLADAISWVLKRPLAARYQPLKPELLKLSDEVLALATLQCMFHGMAERETIRQTYRAVGSAVAGELWASELHDWNPRIHARTVKAAKQKHGSYSYRVQAGRCLAAKDSFKTEVKLARLRCGEFLVGIAIRTLPEAFEITELPKPENRPARYHAEYTLTLTDAALEVVDEAIREAVLRNPVWLPLTQPPRPWTGVYEGGTWDARLQPLLSLVRSRQKSTLGAVQAAIRDGSMKPALDAVNALQAVPWTINHRVLGVQRECIRRQIEVKGLNVGKLMEKPEQPDDWDDMTEDQQKAWRISAGEVKLANLRAKGEACLQSEDYNTADYLAAHDRFWCPMNMDWRGRVYGVPSFNFQRDDRVRALFLFADGEIIGEEGIYWLKVHLANCGDFNKVSKQPFDARVQWVNENIQMISDIATAPLANVGSWSTADKPFLFLAACFELISAMEAPSAFVSRLPVAWDGSCSGLQHLCAATRAEEGHLVNLTPQETPADVYQVVADRVHARVAAQSETGSSDLEENSGGTASIATLARQCLDYIWNSGDAARPRKTVKRNVMTYSYSSKRFGMAQQYRDDLMKPLAFKVLQGKLKAHPFGADKGRAAAKYLADHVYSTIEEVVHKPAQAMDFLQKIAKVLAHEGKPVRWTTPTGLPWINRYHEPDTMRVTLWMHDRGVDIPFQTSLTVGDKKVIDKDKSANSVAPNLVHALDAAHLVWVVRGALREGMASLATVHDSFGCLASRAGRFRKIIREQFVALYEQHDPLTEVLQQAQRDLTVPSCGRLPEVPERGPLDITEVLDAEFAFA